MEIFGLVILTKKEHDELVDCWHVRGRVSECFRWFSGWKDLDIIWEYLLKPKAGIDNTREDYAVARKTDRYGKRLKK